MLAPADRRATAALAALALSAFAFVTCEVLPIGLLTVIGPAIHRTPSATGLLVTAYAAIVVLASVPLTWLTRRVPRRPLLTVTLALFAAGNLLTALAPDFAALLAARMATALSQALFWSIVAPTAAALFPPAARGRTLARLAIGNSLAPVLGIPLGTLLGQQFGWRAPFAIMTGIGVVTCLAVARLLPSAPVAAAEDRREPLASANTRAYIVLVVATAIAVTGSFAALTYITPFLLDVAHFHAGALGPLLLVSGVAGIAATIVVGRFLDRRAEAAVIVPILLVTAALLLLYGLGTHRLAAVAGQAALGFAFSALAVAIQNRTLHVAPGNPDLASAGTSTAFNVGIAAGSLVGAALIPVGGVRVVMLAGAVLAALSAGVLQIARRRPAPVPVAVTPEPVAC